MCLVVKKGGLQNLWNSPCTLGDKYIDEMLRLPKVTLSAQWTDIFSFSVLRLLRGFDSTKCLQNHDIMRYCVKNDISFEVSTRQNVYRFMRYLVNNSKMTQND